MIMLSRQCMGEPVFNARPGMRKIIPHAPRSPMAIIILDARGVIKKIRTAGSTFLEYHRNEIIERKINLLLPDFKPLLSGILSTDHKSSHGKGRQGQPVLTGALDQSGVRHVVRVILGRSEAHDGHPFRLYVYAGRKGRTGGLGSQLISQYVRNRRMQNLARSNLALSAEINQALTSAMNHVYAVSCASHDRANCSGNGENNIALEHLRRAMASIEYAGKINKTLAQSMEQIERLVPIIEHGPINQQSGGSTAIRIGRISPTTTSSKPS